MSQQQPQWPMLSMPMSIPIQMPMADMTSLQFPTGPMPKLTPQVNNETAKPLIEWFEKHLTNPYPTDKEMEEFRNVTGFTFKQVSF